MAILCREVTPLEIAGVGFKWDGKLRMKLKVSTPGGERIKKKKKSCKCIFPRFKENLFEFIIFRDLAWDFQKNPGEL